jgi:DNA-binding transcriptional MerR regulator
MTDRDLKDLQQMTHASVQDENGIDVTQIDELLSMSPTERLRTLEEFITNLEFLDRVREEHEARTARVDPTAARGER